MYTLGIARTFQFYSILQKFDSSSSLLSTALFCFSRRNALISPPILQNNEQCFRYGQLSCKPRERSWRAKGGCLHSPREGKRWWWWGEGNPSPKTIPREKKGETGPRTPVRSRSSVHKEESSHLHNSEKVGLWEGGAPGTLESAECGEGPRLQGLPGDWGGPESRPALQPFVRAEMGVCPAAFCAGYSRWSSCAAAEGQEPGPGASGRGREGARADAAYPSRQERVQNK